MAYTKNGVEYPSVTTILGLLDKPALTYWAANCAVDFIRDNIEEIQDPTGPHKIEDILNRARTAFKDSSTEAKDIGSHVHRMIEAHIAGKPIPDDVHDKAENGYLAFLEWEKLNRVVWLESELTLISELHGYAGTCDAIALVNEHKYLIDFKTAKGFYPEYEVQCAAYLQALKEERAQEDVNLIGLLRLDKETGVPEWKDVTFGWNQKVKAFNNLVEFYYSACKRRLKNNPWVAKYWNRFRPGSNGGFPPFPRPGFYGSWRMKQIRTIRNHNYNEETGRVILNYIKNHPGSTAYRIARDLGIVPRTVISQVMTLTFIEPRLYESDKSKLYLGK